MAAFGCPPRAERRLIAELGRVPSQRDMVAIFAKRGFHVSAGTIHADYRELTIDSGRTVEARAAARRQAQSTPLSVFPTA